MSRISWNSYFLDLAEGASKRGSCPRLQVGAVLVDTDNGIIATGYNGAPRGLPSCDEVGCLILNDRCERTLHAEINAIIQAGRNGASTRDSILYSTHRPCFRCTLHLIQAGVSSIIYRHDYKSDNEETVLAALRQADIFLFQERGPTLEIRNAE